MSRYQREGLDILKVLINELKSIKYTQFTRNKIRKVYALKHSNLDPLQFRNQCFAYYSLVKQELYQKDLKIETEIHLRKTMQNNQWVK